jgi:DNA repair exonuclease
MPFPRRPAMSWSFTAPICTSITTTPRGCTAATAPPASPGSWPRPAARAPTSSSSPATPFDCHRLPDHLLERAAAVIAAAPLPVVILPGNHDPAVPDAVFLHGALAGVENLHVLGVTHDEAVLFPSLGLEVWGRPHRDYGDMIPFERLRPRSTRWQVAVGHGHYVPVPDRTIRLRPSWLIGDDELAATGSDYIALGHWNRAVKVGNVAAYYSGSPEYAGTVNVVRLGAAGAVAVTRAELDIAREPSAVE